MRIFIDIGHPAYVHYFNNFILKEYFNSSSTNNQMIEIGSTNDGKI